MYCDLSTESEVKFQAMEQRGPASTTLQHSLATQDGRHTHGQCHQVQSLRVKYKTTQEQMSSYQAGLSRGLGQAVSPRGRQGHLKILERRNIGDKISAFLTYYYYKKGHL